MKVKFKCNHEETRLEHHHPLAMLKKRRRKIFEIPMTCFFTHSPFAQRKLSFHMHSHDLSAKKQLKQNIVKRLILQIKSGEEEGDNK